MPFHIRIFQTDMTELTMTETTKTYRHILVARSDAVGIIKLNRPEVLNSFNRAMSIEVQDALQLFLESQEVRAVLLTGAGRGFCAGQDLAEFTNRTSAEAHLATVVNEQFNPIVRLLRTMEKPVVCALNGVAAGAGANIALSCDFIIASENASLLQSFSKVGLVPDSGGTYLLPRLVGLSRATQLTMLGEKLPAAEALALGLIFQVVPESTLQDESLRFAQRLASMPTRALGLTKRSLNTSLDNNFEQQLNLEARLQEEAGTTEDFAEGVRAFIQKRHPKFKGK
jgi:2-(1,2-epoxy-1,2-dihydrophenyl)acetyl-CoA isomerase